MISDPRPGYISKIATRDVGEDLLNAGMGTSVTAGTITLHKRLWREHPRIMRTLGAVRP